MNNNPENKIKLKDFFSRIKDIYKPFLGVIVTIMVIMVIQEGLSLLGPYIYGKIIDAIFQGISINHVLFLCLLSFVIYLLNNVIITYIANKIEVERFEFDVPRLVAEKTFNKVFSFSIGQHENQNSGINKSIIDRGQNSLVELANLSIYQIIPTVIQVIVTIVALLFIAPILGLICSLGVVVYILSIIHANNQLDDEYNKLRDRWTESDKEQSELLRNVSLVKLNAKEKQSTDEYIGNYLNINKEEKVMWMKFTNFARGREAIAIITRMATIVVGVFLVYQGEYTPGFLVVAFSWSNNAFDRIGYFSGIFRRTLVLCSRVQNYFILMDVVPDIKENENPILLEKYKGRIEYKNIFFKYEDRQIIIEDNGVKEKEKTKKKNAVKNINIIIKEKQKVAIVGHSGAGKSTLIQLLIRAYDPNKGEILIDGVNLKNLSLENYRRSLGVVPQDVSLFDNTLRYNILFGTNKKVSDKDLNKAIRMARMEGFLKKMENGLDTVIGERGVKLSGGERQRVGIARALVKNPAILIFDEATSSLDAENEALIKQSIEKAAQGRTTIIIAHRLSTIKDANKIIVLDNGVVVGEGTHSQLLKRCEYYKKMINIQTVIVGNS